MTEPRPRIPIDVGIAAAVRDLWQRSFWAACSPWSAIVALSIANHGLLGSDRPAYDGAASEDEPIFVHGVISHLVVRGALLPHNGFFREGRAECVFIPQFPSKYHNDKIY